MSDDLARITALRPPVGPPTVDAREQARVRLRAAISASGTAQSRAGAATRGGPATLAMFAAVAATIAVTVGAVALFGHRGERHAAVPGASRSGQVTRGAIVDRSGEVLAGERTVFSVELVRARLAPSSAHARVLRRLAAILPIASGARTCATPHGQRMLMPLTCDLDGIAAQRRRQVTAAVDVSPAVARALARDRLPGVTVARTAVRTYPDGELAAQVLGTVGPVTAQELREPAYRGISPTAIIGQSGLEASYDSYLRAGDTLRTSLSAPLQRVGQDALAHSIEANRPADGGAFVAMNPQTGAVYAMGSMPSFDPALFTRSLSRAAYQRLAATAADEPLVDRAVDSAGPTGSTFKPITATAAMQSGLWSPDETYDDTGQFCMSGQCRRNAGGAANGVVNLVNAIRVSSDVFFYHLGALLNVANPATQPNGGALQEWARKFGIGQKTGIDLPGEDAGTLPTPRWRAQRNELEYECDRAIGPFRGGPHHAPGGCGIADGTNRPWSVGDNINLAVGQGDVQVMPLQLAVAYAALANGGTIVRPHVGSAVENNSGTVQQKIDPPAARHININPVYLDTIREALRAASSHPGGTTADVFGVFPEQVYGLAGTAQYAGQADQAWYAGFVPATATSKPIVVVVTVEQGGWGAVAAAPVAREILSQWFLGKPGPYVAGHSHTL